MGVPVLVIGPHVEIASSPPRNDSFFAVSLRATGSRLGHSRRGSTARPYREEPRLCSECLFTMRYNRFGFPCKSSGRRTWGRFPACAMADAVRHPPGSLVSRTGGGLVLLLKT